MEQINGLMDSLEVANLIKGDSPNGTGHNVKKVSLVDNKLSKHNKKGAVAIVICPGEVNIKEGESASVRSGIVPTLPWSSRFKSLFD